MQSRLFRIIRSLFAISGRACADRQQPGPQGNCMLTLVSPTRAPAADLSIITDLPHYQAMAAMQIFRRATAAGRRGRPGCSVGRVTTDLRWHSPAATGPGRRQFQNDRHGDPSGQRQTRHLHVGRLHGDLTRRNVCSPEERWARKAAGTAVPPSWILPDREQSWLAAGSFSA